MSERPRLWFAVPEGVDEPARVSGGNVYDRRIVDGLRADGWEVRMLGVRDAVDGLQRALAGVPDGTLLLVDGLLAGPEPDALLRHGDRLLLALLAHMPPGNDDSAAADALRSAFRSARLVIATSAWTRSELIAQDAVAPDRIVVAHPGADVTAGAESRPSADGGRLLCVGVVAPHKGQDVLVEALSSLREVPAWSCTFAGSLDVDPDFVARLRATVTEAGLAERVDFAGVLTGSALDEASARADLLVAPSRSESFGMAVADALARGIPVLASGVGGIPEAVAGNRGAVTVPPGDSWALERVLRRWWGDPEWRAELTGAAREGRGAMRTWADASAIVARALQDAAHGRHPGRVGSLVRP
ncbi:glycosyltransferase family 4 protein [Leifsonia sp. 2TAF2]|uniref:glycosyltransferase family 4 protein n=1 Tax=Leifsonia sp. 2TAF2 TaxID=3233009 RepID=UPI003F9E468E